MGGSLYWRRHAYDDCGRRWDTAGEKASAVEKHQRERRGYRGLGERRRSMRASVLLDGWISFWMRVI